MTEARRSLALTTGWQRWRRRRQRGCATGRRVFISGPMSTCGEPSANWREAAKAAGELLALGFSPYVPHVSWLLAAVAENPVDDWRGLALDWVGACDIVLRLPGESRGADAECKRARELGIPIFTSVEEIRRRYGIRAR